MLLLSCTCALAAPPGVAKLLPVALRLLGEVPPEPIPPASPSRSTTRSALGMPRGPLRAHVNPETAPLPILPKWRGTA